MKGSNYSILLSLTQSLSPGTELCPVEQSPEQASTTEPEPGFLPPLATGRRSDPASSSHDGCREQLQCGLVLDMTLSLLSGPRPPTQRVSRPHLQQGALLCLKCFRLAAGARPSPGLTCTLQTARALGCAKPPARLATRPQLLSVAAAAKQ